MPTRLTTEDFIEKAAIKHGRTYQYSNTKYLGATHKIEITCPTHGGFLQLPGNHLKGSGCPVCGVSTLSKPRFTTDEFISKSKATHGDAYDYSRVRYLGHNSKVEIICPTHGSFWQRANNHLAGVGCNQCGRYATAKLLTKTDSTFVLEASRKHDQKYDYSHVVYTGAFNYVEIVCTLHGSFWQTPDNHLNAGAGCPSCSHHYSKPHKEIESLLSTLGVAYKPNDRTLIAPKELDIVVTPDRRLAIEFNGRYWHSLCKGDPPELKYYHRDKFYECKNRGILLLQVDEHEWNNPVTQLVWKSVIASKVGAHHRIYARNTEFRAISKAEASAFLSVNHLQGDTPAIRWAFGLFNSQELVGVITFANHQKQYVNLSRLAFSNGLTIVGGAEKLFNHALPQLPPKDIITFSNNRYSDGAIYPRFGFVLESKVAPSYQWYWRGRVWNKRLLRRKSLIKHLGNRFNPAESEHDNLYRAGARCLYDAGYQKWHLYR